MVLFSIYIVPVYMFVFDVFSSGAYLTDWKESKCDFTKHIATCISIDL